MTEKKKPALKGRAPPEGDKRQFLLSIEARIIKAIKLAAMEDDMTASALMEEIAEQWLARRKAARMKKAGSGEINQ